jgi:hypothetical protein
MRIVPAVVALALVAAAAPAAKLPPPMRLNLIPATCAVLPPALPGPCSARVAFAAGTVTLQALRQPQPTCPKTGRPTEAPGGTVRMTGVTTGGAPFSGTLTAQANYKTAFGDDPNGNCELRNVVVPSFPSLLGTLECRNGKCRGTLYPVECLPAHCADVPVRSEFGTVEAGGQQFGPIVVFDDAGVPLATPGTAVAGGREP